MSRSYEWESVQQQARAEVEHTADLADSIVELVRTGYEKIARNLAEQVFVMSTAPCRWGGDTVLCANRDLNLMRDERLLRSALKVSKSMFGSALSCEATIAQAFERAGDKSFRRGSLFYTERVFHEFTAGKFFDSDERGERSNIFAVRVPRAVRKKLENKLHLTKVGRSELTENKDSLAVALCTANGLQKISKTVKKTTITPTYAGAEIVGISAEIFDHGHDPDSYPIGRVPTISTGSDLSSIFLTPRKVELSKLYFLCAPATFLDPIAGGSSFFSRYGCPQAMYTVLAADMCTGLGIAYSALTARDKARIFAATSTMGIRLRFRATPHPKELPRVWCKGENFGEKGATCEREEEFFALAFSALNRMDRSLPTPRDKMNFFLSFVEYLAQKDNDYRVNFDRGDTSAQPLSVRAVIVWDKIWPAFESSFSTQDSISTVPMSLLVSVALGSLMEEDFPKESNESRMINNIGFDFLYFDPRESAVQALWAEKILFCPDTINRMFESVTSVPLKHERWEPTPELVHRCKQSARQGDDSFLFQELDVHALPSYSPGTIELVKATGSPFFCHEGQGAFDAYDWFIQEVSALG